MLVMHIFSSVSKIRSVLFAIFQCYVGGCGLSEDHFFLMTWKICVLHLIIMVSISHRLPPVIKKGICCIHRYIVIYIGETKLIILYRQTIWKCIQWHWFCSVRCNAGVIKEDSVRSDVKYRLIQCTLDMKWHKQMKHPQIKRTKPAFNEKHFT